MPERVLAAARRGERLDLAGDGRFDGRKPEVSWPADREVPASVLLGILTATEGVHPRGVRVRGARIVGEIDWEWQRLLVPLDLVDCTLDAPVHLDHATVAGLSLVRCRIPGLSAEHLVSASTVRLSRSVFTGSVLLKDASVDGELVLSGSTVEASQRHQRTRYAIDAHRLRTTGSLNLEHRFRAEGAVNLAGARIGGSLQCSGGHFTNPGSSALIVSDAEVRGNIHLTNGFQAQGRVAFNRTKVEGNFSCDGGSFADPAGDALTAERITVGGALLMRGQFGATGRVRLTGARIGGNLDCTNGRFDGHSGDSIQGSGILVEGDVVLRGGFRSAGRIGLDNARVSGMLDCDGATLVNPGGQALRAMNLAVGGDVRFDDEATGDHFGAEGDVCLAGARIGGSVICVGGSFRSPERSALDLADAEVGGNVWMTGGTTVAGTLGLVRCRIQGDFSFWASTLEGTFSGRGMTLAGNFSWARAPRRPHRMDLRRAQVGQIDDDESSWPDWDGLLIDGFTYDRLSSRAPSSPAERLAWIRRQPGFMPEPYQQLVHVYRRNGQLDEATTVAMAQQDDLRRRGDLNLAARAWNWFIGRSLGHGYRPARAAWALVAVYLVTLAAVWLGARNDAFIQTGETAPQPAVTSSHCGPQYPCLSAPAYSLESVVPILNLHQRDQWQPRSTTFADRALRDWLYLSTVLGYAGTTLLAAGLSGLARKT
ncbi:hypothetical protein LWF15_12275 [Kineosporia rhizophila]|uniref:hypothetical protein n=1 Tax=Kineosporia TaxID=49184 RepID=UPI001E5DD51E|nr:MULTISPECIES: hypothetical protein [Kineosporia]MCE0536285.1 hypothetical protein [Kineosporia rhizophila]GLY15129.1 hypothetical protein Kisp01_21440 [Kineosporia sp. NBRC 101677]